MKKKKIAVIGLKGLPAFGGAATVGENIIEQLKDKYDFTVYATSSHTDFKTGVYNGYKQIVFKKIQIKKLNILYYYLSSLFHILFNNEYDIIHLHHRTAAFTLLFFKKSFKTVTTLHSVVAIQKFKYFKYYFTLQDYILYKKSDIIINVSKYNTSLIEKKAKHKLFYIPNGISIIQRNELVNINENNYILFSAARIINEKGCHIFLNALQAINYKGQIIVIGDLSQQKKYKKELLKLSKVLNVNYIGLIKDKTLLFSYIKRAKYFVFPSLVEAMSMMLLEVVSLKIPVICSNIFANKTIFNENEVLFFESNNYNDLKEKILFANNNTLYMKMIAENAYKKVVKNYTWNKIAKKYEVIFNNLLNEK